MKYVKPKICITRVEDAIFLRTSGDGEDYEFFNSDWIFEQS